MPATLKPRETPSHTPQEVRAVLDGLHPDETVRHQLATLLEDSLEKAHDTNPASWCLTLDPRRSQVRLMVGRIFTLSLQPGEMAVSLVDDGFIAPTHPKGISGEVAGAFKSLPGVLWHRLDAEGLLEQWPELRSAHLDAVERAAKQVRRTPHFFFHQPAVLEAIGERSDRTPPVPEHGEIDAEAGEGGEETGLSTLPGSKVREVRSLLGELLEEWILSAEGRRQVELYRHARRQARDHLEKLLAAEQRGDDLGEMVFQSLLPHADREAAHDRGAWVWPGGFLPPDSVAWLTETRDGRPAEVPRIAAAALDFVRHSVEDPSSLPDICRGFAALPYTRGLDSALLTPILGALRPQEFAPLDHRLRRLVNYLASRHFGAGLAEYPAANAVARSLLERFGDELAIAEEFGLAPADLLHLLALWLGRVVQHPFSATRYWWLRGPEGDDAWAAARHTGLVTLEEGLELGDLSRISRRELDAERERLGELADPLWAFSREVADGDRLAVHRNGEVVAVATVVGGYRFSRGAATGHSLPVEWDDPNPPRPSSPPPEDTRLAEMDRATFEEHLAPRPGGPGPTAGTTAPPATGDGAPESPGPPPAGGDDETTATLLHPFHTLERVAEESHLEVAELTLWIQALRRRGQVLWLGPPGTGKTFLAHRLARHLLSGSDGVEEIRPLYPGLDRATLLGREDDSGLAALCRTAAGRQGPSVLVLDDLHRVDAPAVLGELLYLLEHRGETIRLGGGGRLTVPPQLRVLATWTVGPDLPPPDAALLRRFAVFPLPPRLDVLERFHGDRPRLARALVHLLEQIERELADPAAALGIAPFLDARLGDHLESVWRTEVEPALELRLAGRPETVESFRWERVEGRFDL